MSSQTFWHQLTVPRAVGQDVIMENNVQSFISGMATDYNAMSVTAERSTLRKPPVGGTTIRVERTQSFCVRLVNV